MVLIAHGLSNADIAGHLHLSPATVKTHIGRLLAKLRARDRARLVIIAYEAGLAGSVASEPTLGELSGRACHGRPMTVHTHHVARVGDTIVKRYTSHARGEHHREFTALTLLRDAAPGLAPRPLRLDDDGNEPVLTMSVVPGEPLGGGPVTPRQLDALATALRTLWSVPAGELPPRRPSSAADLAYGRGLITARRPPATGIVAEAHRAALAWWDGPEAGAHFTAPHGPGVLGHGDANLPNYLWSPAEERVRIVDFEDAGSSDPALELATLAEHLSARDTDWEPWLARFDVDPARLTAARKVWAVFWLQMLMPGGPSADRNPPEVLHAQAERVLTLM